MATGNTVVALASERFPLPAVTLSEVLATSDVPGGVINVLTGRTAEVAPWLASHMDVNAIDLAGAPDALAGELAVGGRREPQARRPGRAGGLDADAWPAADARLPGNQDRLAPRRHLTPHHGPGRDVRHAQVRICRTGPGRAACLALMA